ncbi:BTAD domain-containing putative transcriptional regulator [Micromonospora sp. CA-240977]|uniref:AfsR/SARP family transcriptional regulator n=1 Tax=Micromonospora sp. CA-240977 TaxID=3239957 RepID=UPI003D95055B
MIQFELMGPLRVLRDGAEVDVGPRQRQLILAMLMARAGQPSVLAEIESLLWPGDAPSTAANVVQHHISRLRRVLEPGLSAREPGRWIARTTGGYRLAVTAADLDLLKIRELRARGLDAMRTGRNGDAVDAYKHARSIWKGPCASGLEPYGPGALLFAAIDSEMTEMVSEFSAFALGIGAAAIAEPVLRQSTQRHPLDESLRAQLLLVLAATGKQAEALASYHELRQRLREELGIDPGPRLQRAFENVLHQKVQTSTPEKELTAAADTPDAVLETPSQESGAGAKRAMSPTAPRPAQLPPALPQFTGRQDEMAHLVGQLIRNSTGVPRSPIVCLDGMPGCGKTALAVNLAHTVAASYPDGQLYADLQGFGPARAPIDPADVLRGFLYALGFDGRDLPERLTDLSALFRSALAGKSVLILLDNARDSDQVSDLLPGTPQSAVIVTGRTRLLHLSATRGTALTTLSLPSNAESHDMLAAMLGHQLGSDRIDNEPKALEEIIDLCGRLPAAMAIIGARAASHPFFALADIAADLRTAPHILDGFQPDGQRGGLRALFAWSYQLVDIESARLFRLLPEHPGREFTAPSAASLTGVAPRAARELLTDLTRAGLLMEPRPGRYSWHSLLAAYAAELNETELETDRGSARRRIQSHFYLAALRALQMIRGVSGPGAQPHVKGVALEEFATPQAAAAWLKAEQLTLGELLGLARRDGDADLADGLAEILSAPPVPNLGANPDAAS